MTYKQNVLTRSGEQFRKLLDDPKCNGFHVTWSIGLSTLVQTRERAREVKELGD